MVSTSFIRRFSTSDRNLAYKYAIRSLSVACTLIATMPIVSIHANEASHVQASPPVSVHLDDGDTGMAIDSVDADPQANSPFRLTAAKAMLQPAVEAPEPNPLGVSVQPSSPANSTEQRGGNLRLFGAGLTPVSFPLYRRALATSPATDIVLGLEGTFRVTTEVGNLLGKSQSVRGVSVQARTPIVSDPRVRGDRTGKLLASGSHWIPVRQDLDTAVSKIDSRSLDNVLVIKGPYAARYGPGFDFIDFQLKESPRYANGYQSEGSTSLEYKTNGQQWYGRTSLQGGDDEYGYRVEYGHRTGSDYDTGGSADGSFNQPTSLPTSYNSRHIFVAAGQNLSDNAKLEFNYLRMDQTDLEFPGLVYDLDYLVTDGFEARYTVVEQPEFDELSIEGWYNQSRMAGDSNRTGKTTQIPSLLTTLQPFGFPVPGNAITDARASSAGARSIVSWGEAGCNQLRLGSDITVVKQELNDIEDPAGLGFFFPTPVNLPIPKSESVDVGLFCEANIECTDTWRIKSGARIDFVQTDAVDSVTDLRHTFDFFNGFPLVSVSDYKQAGLDQSFTPLSIFAVSEHDVHKNWTAKLGVGYAERPPSLTELYSAGAFIGSLQSGLTRLEGDPELARERKLQFDVGVEADYGALRMAANGYYSRIRDFIIYDDFGGPFIPTSTFQRVFYGNTDLATLAGVELMGELDVNRGVTLFGSLEYVEGKDRSRSKSSRLGSIFRETFAFLPGSSRSRVVGTDTEALPGIAPLESTVGIRLHEPDADPNWGLELAVRIVDNQDRVAATLAEVATPGFTTWSIRGFAQVTSDFLVTAGVENIGDKFYREHLDYRPGRGVFQPGTNFYFAGQVTY